MGGWFGFEAPVCLCYFPQVFFIRWTKGPIKVLDDVDVLLMSNELCAAFKLGEDGSPTYLMGQRIWPRSMTTTTRGRELGFRFSKTTRHTT